MIKTRLLLYFIFLIHYVVQKVIYVVPQWINTLFLLFNKQSIILSKFNDWKSWPKLHLVQNRFYHSGQLFAVSLFENFLRFLKLQYSVHPLQLLQNRLFTTIDLPYRLYVIKKSNRNYFFPGPVFSSKEQQNLVLRNLSHALKKRDGTLIDQFFLEIIYFLTRHSESYLLRQLDQMLVMGMENRAYLHYRWLLKR